MEAVKETAEDIADVASTCFKLNSLQLRVLLENYLSDEDEPVIPQGRRINLNYRLDFDIHVANICNRLGKKLYALARISEYMNIHKRRVTMKAFIASEFGYCPLVWMFHRRKVNSRVKKFRERALRIVYQDYASSFSELLEKDNPTTIRKYPVASY